MTVTMLLQGPLLNGALNGLTPKARLSAPGCENLGKGVVLGTQQDSLTGRNKC